MSHFYGTLQGSRGAATRCGTRRSGISASAQSYNGSITVELDDVDGETFVTIGVREGSGVGGRMIFRSKMRELLSSPKLLMAIPHDPHNPTGR